LLVAKYQVAELEMFGSGRLFDNYNVKNGILSDRQ
jgi:hypothetical protein